MKPLALPRTTPDMNRRQLLLGALCLAALPDYAQSAPRQYGIGPEGATISYTFNLNGAPVKGTAPLSRAAIRIDPGNLGAATADVSADIRRARTGLIFATEAMKSASVLDANRFPEARFVSTRVNLGAGGRISDGATIDGRLTLRGVTRDIRLKAGLYRQRNAAQNDLSRLSIQLTGSLSRAAFGASGYPELVDDTVRLDIRADIAAIG